MNPAEQYKKVDFLLLLFFACLFVVVHGVNEEGWAIACASSSRR